MLAADRSLLEVNLRQSAIKLREKELNLYTENFSAMATQAAVLAGFTTTCLIEITIPPNTNVYAEHFLYMCAIVSICANISCVSLSTITTIWGSGKALRGKDGSMDEAVDGMSKERNLIFRAFAVGLAGNLSTVMTTCFIIMDPPLSFLAVIIVMYTAWLIGFNALRIQKKFQLVETVHLDDLTRFPTMTFAHNSSGGGGGSSGAGGTYNYADSVTNGGGNMSLLGSKESGRYRTKSALDAV